MFLKINKNSTKDFISATRNIRGTEKDYRITIIDKDFNVFDWVLNFKEFLRLKKFIDVRENIMF